MEDSATVTGTTAADLQQPTSFTPEQQALMNKVVAREKASAAEKATRAAEEKYQRELEALNAQREQRNATTSREVDSDAIYQQVTERLNKEMQERQMKDQMTQVANNYLQKVGSAKANYEDFDEVTGNFDPTAFPQLTFLLSGIENAGDVLYELSKNPEKLAQVDYLAQRSPKFAQASLTKLSKSISDNRQAQSEAQTQTVSEPLDRLQPSRVANSNGKMSIQDLRNQPWLRG